MARMHTKSVIASWCCSVAVILMPVACKKPAGTANSGTPSARPTPTSAATTTPMVLATGGESRTRRDWWKERDGALKCTENLVGIEGMMDVWAFEHDKPEGTTCTIQDLHPFFRNFRFKTAPRCPLGGNYPRIFTVGVTPTCDYTPPKWFNTVGDTYAHKIPDF